LISQLTHAVTRPSLVLVLGGIFSFVVPATVTGLEDFAVLGVVSGVGAMELAVLGTARLLLLKFLLLGRLVGSLGDLLVVAFGAFDMFSRPR
jgi:hypothetical protein